MKFVVFNFQSDWWRSAPSALANVGARPPHRVSMGAGKSAARRNSLRRVSLAGLISQQPGGAATWGKQRRIEERWAFRMVCSSRCGTRHVQSGFSNIGEIDVFGRNLRHRFCARSHTSHDGKLGIVRDDVAAFGISSQNNCQDYTVLRMGLTK